MWDVRWTKAHHYEQCRTAASAPAERGQQAGNFTVSSLLDFSLFFSIFLYFFWQPYSLAIALLR
jgi:hypothetical protein